jgi:putative endonuclease
MGWWKKWRRKFTGETGTEPLPDHIRAGLWGERVAERLLRSKRYRIVGRRVRVGDKLELDLVARSKGVLVFVEVKTRRTEDFGRPFDAIRRDKRKNLSRAALRYMDRLKKRPDFFRFDVVEVVGVPDGEPRDIRHIENAFTLEHPLRVGW